MKFEGKLELDKDLCIGCGRCALVCPYEGMDIKKPFEGKIELIEKNLGKCDPLGCQACFNVCPTQCWYVDERGKAAPVKELCILCGACANVCPVSAIEVNRSEVHHTDVKDTPWASEWKDAISSIITGEKQRPDVSGAVVPHLKRNRLRLRSRSKNPIPNCLNLLMKLSDLLNLFSKSLKSDGFWKKNLPSRPVPRFKSA